MSAAARGIADQTAVARAVQAQLVPAPAPDVPGLEWAVRFLPSRAVGGDFCDCFCLGSGFAAFYLGDVQGKGLEGAMYALLASGLMRGLTKTGQEPSDVVSFLNRRLRFRALPTKFCCLTYGVIDLEKRQLALANAGLPYPLLLRGDTLTQIEASGIPLGLFESDGYDQAALSLQPGDRLLFYTDGLPDSLAALHPRQGDGDQQLEFLMLEHREKPAPELADLLVHYLRSSRHRRRRKELTDDSTFIALHAL